jgi:glycosyltransferase involved in cell wall biosynthesis
VAKNIHTKVDIHEIKYKFLVYPNITYQQKLEKDSYIQVIGNVIKVLNKIRNDIHFTLVLPDFVESLKLPNVEQVIYEMPTFPNAMRTHFDYDKLSKIVRGKNADFDVVYSHLPEHTLQLSNLFNNTTDMSPLFLGYCHWYEIKENTTYKRNMFLLNIIGTLEMEECGVNSVWLKELIIDRSKEYFSEEVANRLEQIIQPHYLGIDEIYTHNRQTEKNSILFNHRPNNYTGWDWFIETLDELWKKRKDFHLYTTLTDANRPYSTEIKLNNRKEYLDFLRKMYIGVGCFEKYSAWSIATTDGLSQGVPYLLPNDLCYPEMLGDYPLFYKGREDFKSKLNNLLDRTEETEKAVNWLKPRFSDFLWESRVAHWFNEWKVLNELPTVKRTEKYKEIVKFIKRKRSVTKAEIKKHMNWGVGIGFSRYRNLLRLEKGIKFTKDTYEFVG